MKKLFIMLVSCLSIFVGVDQISANSNPYNPYSKEMYETTYTPEFYFNGEHVKTDYTFDGSFIKGDYTLPGLIQLHNVFYVPVDFLTKNMGWSFVFDGKMMHLTAKNPTTLLGIDPLDRLYGRAEAERLRIEASKSKQELELVKQKFKEITGKEFDYVDIVIDDLDGEYPSDYDENYTNNEKMYLYEDGKIIGEFTDSNIFKNNDFNFFGIQDNLSISDTVNKLQFKNKVVTYLDNEVFLTDSKGTDTSFFMTLSKGANDNTIGMYYEDFSTKFSKLNYKYKVKQQPFTSPRGITTGSNIGEVFKKYNEINPIIKVGDIDPERKGLGEKLQNKITTSFNLSINPKDIQLTYRDKNIPINSDTNKLNYIEITFKDNFDEITYYAVSSKDESIEKAIVYGFKYHRKEFF